MRRDVRWLRPLTGAAILGLLLWRVGTGPFLDALRRVDGGSVAAATGIAAVTTVCCAWRWALVAHGLGVVVPLRSAVAEYYRSQFLNVTLPSGVLGDVHRGIRHGRDVGDLGRGLRSVVWERTAGQVVLVVAAICALVVLPSPVRAALHDVDFIAVAISMASAAAIAVIIAVAIAIAHHKGHPSMVSRIGRTAVADVRAGLLRRHTVLGVVALSGVALAGNVATFVLAARSAGSTASPAQLLPLALVVLLTMGLPLSIAGWGPREGVAAWAFGAAGLGFDQGVTVAVVYGVMVLLASLPGAGLLLLTRSGRREVGPANIDESTRLAPVAGADEAAHA